jgi:hypothetical protein
MLLRVAHAVRTSLLALLLTVAACTSTPDAKTPETSGQSFPQALAMICDVDRLAGIEAAADPVAIGGKRTAWIAEKVDNPDAIELRTLLSVKGAQDQARMLREQAKALHVQSCALADSLEREGTGGLSP